MSLVACDTCGLVQRLPELTPGASAECVRCGAALVRADGGSLARTAAFALAALMFYLPANLYPILRMEWYGMHSESTAWDGAITLFRQGQAAEGVAGVGAEDPASGRKLSRDVFCLPPGQKGGAHERARAVPGADGRGPRP